jgi:hypothetical protein
MYSLGNLLYVKRNFTTRARSPKCTYIGTYLVSGHYESRAGLDRQPVLAEALVVQLLDELELDWHLGSIL